MVNGLVVTPRVPGSIPVDGFSPPHIFSDTNVFFNNSRYENSGSRTILVWYELRSSSSRTDCRNPENVLKGVGNNTSQRRRIRPPFHGMCLA